MSADSHRRARRAGFTLVELLITALIMGTALVAAAWSMSATARTKAAYAETDATPQLLAKEVFELAASLPCEPAGTTGVTNADDVTALDALVGASFSPAILADGSVAEGFDGWSQSTALSVFDVNDLTVPTNDPPEAGLPPDAGKLFRLDVTISRDGDELATFPWWITP